MSAKTSSLLDQIKPTLGYVLIEPEAAQKQTSGGIYLPDNASGDKPQQGTVLAIGAPMFHQGKEIASPAKKGDKVIYKKWGGNEVKLDGKEYMFVKFEDLMAVIN